MSLNDGKLKELLDNQKEILKIIRDLADTVQLVKDELASDIEDSHKELLGKIQSVEAYQKTILEPNQHILLDAIHGEEEETKEPKEE